MQNFKESWQNMPAKTRNMIKAIVVGTVAIALIAIIALRLGSNPDYGVLFTGMSQEEAQQVVALLQDDGINYQYDSNNGSIRVPEAVADQTRASLLSRGYPKNGFAYDMYLDNTGLMTTESDKDKISLYDLQDRLGATIRLFDGVQDAKVTIVEATQQKYALGDDSGRSASASVTVTMKNGNTLTSDKAQAVKNLISHSVKGMDFTEVAVFDAATMMEVGGDGGSSSGLTDITSLTAMVESNIAANVRRVLEKLYGSGNVEVSVKGTLNMERLIQESTQYSTPEKINEDDKIGLLQTEDIMNENLNAADQAAGGLVGADANADTPRYTNNDGTNAVTDSYANGSSSRLWLYNVLKEQRQIDPGFLEDTSIGIVILTNDNTTVAQDDLYRLVANAAGIPVDTVNEKVTIIRAPQQPAEGEGTTPGGDIPVIGDPPQTLILPLPVLIAIGAGILLLFLLILLLLLRRRRKKKAMMMLTGDGDELTADGEGLEAEGLVADSGQGIEGSDSGGPVTIPSMEDDELTKSEEILNLRMQRSLRLKQSIGEFVDQNPQIAAKLVQSWLRGEEAGSDGSSGGGSRKRAK